MKLPKNKKQKIIKAWAVFNNAGVITENGCRDIRCRALSIFDKKIEAIQDAGIGKVVPVEIRIISPKKGEVGKK